MYSPTAGMASNVIPSWDREARYICAPPSVNRFKLPLEGNDFGKIIYKRLRAGSTPISWGIGSLIIRKAWVLHSSVYHRESMRLSIFRLCSPVSVGLSVCVSVCRLGTC